MNDGNTYNIITLLLHKTDSKKRELLNELKFHNSISDGVLHPCVRGGFEKGSIDLKDLEIEGMEISEENHCF